MPQPDMELVSQLLTRGQAHAAREIAERWVLGQPSNSEALFALARVHMYLKDYVSAETLLRRCLSLRPHDLSIVRAMTWALRNQARPAEAMAACMGAIQRHGELPELLLLKASFHDDQREYPEALAITSQIMDAGLSSADHVQIRVRAMHRLGKSDEAL